MLHGKYIISRRPEKVKKNRFSEVFLYVHTNITGGGSSRALPELQGKPRPCPSCKANRGTIHTIHNGFYCSCSECGAQAIAASYYSLEELTPEQEHRAQRETLARAVRYWNRGDLI